MVRCAHHLNIASSLTVDSAPKTRTRGPTTAWLALKVTPKLSSRHGNQILYRRLASFSSSSYGRSVLDGCSVSKTRRHLCQPVRVANSNQEIKSQSHSYYVFIIGAGIIGLTIARQFLFGSDLSVAIVDAAAPCAGANGAGQGYIWRINKKTETDKWELASRSHELWVNLVESTQHQGLDPLQILGWKKTG